MKRFDKAIKLLKNYLYRLTAKAAIECLEKNWPMKMINAKTELKNLKEAIEILEKHERNKHV